MSRDRALAKLGRETAQGLGEGPSSDRRMAQRHRLVEVASRREKSGALVRARALLLFAPAAAIVAFVAGTRLMPTTAIDFWVGTATVAGTEGASLGAFSDGALPIRFEEGTRVELDPGTRAKVVRSSNKRAEIALDDGSLKAKVTSKSKTGIGWIFEAGPYVVNVRGTEFRLVWQSGSKTMDLELVEGRVEVHGPNIAREGVSLESGHVLHAEVTRGIAEVRPLQRAESSTSVPSVPSAAASATPPGEAPTGEAAGDIAPETPTGRDSVRSGPSTTRKTDPATEWRQLARQAHYAEALAAAREAGFEAQVARVGLVDLALLADTARFARSASEAKLALHALERRFPGSRQARLVPFLLGRVAVDLSSDPSEGVKQFRRYLAASPKGQLAEEAYGRLMLALEKTGDRAGAAEVARSYVERFPTGPNAALARSLLE